MYFVLGKCAYQILKIRTIYCMRSRLKEVTRSLWAEPKVQQKGDVHCFGNTFRKILTVWPPVRMATSTCVFILTIMSMMSKVYPVDMNSAQEIMDVYPYISRKNYLEERVEDCLMTHYVKRRCQSHQNSEFL